jgi:CRISPR-associated protein Cas2
MFEIKNSKRILGIIEADIRNRFEKYFGESDSIMIFHLSKQCKITKYGYAKNDDENLIVI